MCYLYTHLLLFQKALRMKLSAFRAWHDLALALETNRAHPGPARLGC